MIEKSEFGKGPKGEGVELYTLSSPDLVVRIINYGAIITHLFAPDRTGRRSDLVLGFDSLPPYLERHPYFGSLVGRVAGRVTPPSFSVGTRVYPLVANQPPHHLHGGAVGFDQRVFKATIHSDRGKDALQLTYRSPDGEEGYPGNVDVSVTYAVIDGTTLQMVYEATSDQPTPLSLTNHSYFNLQGEASGEIGTHELQILADDYTPVAADFTPLGQRRSVAGEPNDFRTPAALASRIRKLFGEHGDNYLLGPRRPQPTLVARVLEPKSGRTLDVLTTEPCLQFYTGVNLDGTTVGKSGRPYPKFAGLCLECHGYPGALHFSEFESIMLLPGQTYRQETAYRFGVTAADRLPLAPPQ